MFRQRITEIAVTLMILLMITLTSWAEDKETGDRSGSSKTEENRAEKLYQEGWYKETALNDFKGAIETYKKIIDEYPKNETVSAKALFQMGSCYEKLGENVKAEAINAYKRVVNEYVNQKELANKAQDRLNKIKPTELPIKTDPATVKNIEKLSKEIEQQRKDLNKEMEQAWQAIPWTKRLFLNIGPLYNHFDHDLHLRDAIGWRTGLWIPSEGLEMVELGISSIRTKSETEHDSKGHKKDVDITTYTLEWRDFALCSDQDNNISPIIDHTISSTMSSAINNVYTNVSTRLGIQRYSGMEHSDVGPFLSVQVTIVVWVTSSTWFHGFFGPDFVRTSAPDGDTSWKANFSAGLGLEFKF